MNLNQNSRRQRTLPCIQKIIIFAVFIYSFIAQNIVQISAPGDFKLKMESIVIEQAQTLQKIYQTRCENLNITFCTQKSIIMCQGTGKKTCMENFPSASNLLPYLSLQSGVSIPNTNSKDNLTQSSKQFLCSTATLDFQNKLKNVALSNDKQYAWNYIASRDGAYRKTPSQRYNRFDDQAGVCVNYDPRSRPWFSQSVYPRKNIIILLGVKNTVVGPRMNAMKESVKAILNVNSSIQGDHLAIISFSNSSKPLLAGVDRLKDISGKYNNSNLTYLQAYSQKISQLTPDASNLNNYQDAFFLGFQMIKNTVNSNESTNDQIRQYVFMLFTDGNPDQGIDNPTDLLSYINDKKNEINSNLKDSTRNINVSLVAFNINNATTQSLIVQGLSCLNYGMYIQVGGVTEQSSFYEAAFQLYDFFILNNQNDRPIWSQIYNDSFGLGQMVTVTHPVYQEVDGQKQLIAVVGLDVLVSQFSKFQEQINMTNFFAHQAKPFLNTPTECQLHNIRKFKCKTSNCSKILDFTCTQKIQTQIFKAPVDTSSNRYCEQTNIQSSSNVGLIVGIIVGTIIGVGLLVLLIFLYLKKLYCFKNEKAQNPLEPQKPQKSAAPQSRIFIQIPRTDIGDKIYSPARLTQQNIKITPETYYLGSVK